MSKATIQYLIDSGFRAEQFGQDTAFADADPYLQRVLDDAEGLVRINIGNDAYDATTDEESLQYRRLVRAEEEASKAELWSRRAAFIDGSAAQAMDKSVYQERAEYRRAASAAQAAASAWIDAFLAGGEGPGEASMTGLSVGTVVSGPYAQVAS